jgi:hypothetical protein
LVKIPDAQFREKVKLRKDGGNETLVFIKMNSNSIVVLFFSIFSSLTFKCQDKNVSLGILQGVDQIFIGTAGIKSAPGHCAAIALLFQIKGKNSHISFEPIIQITKYTYNSILSEGNRLRLSQFAANIVFLGGVHLNSTVTLKAGFFIHPILQDEIKLIHTDGRNYYRIYGHPYNENYEQLNLQSGFSLGLGSNFGKKERFGFHILLQQFVSGIVSADYVVKTNGFTATDKLAFSEKARPTVLLLGLSMKLGKRWRREKEKLEGE